MRRNKETTHSIHETFDFFNLWRKFAYGKKRKHQLYQYHLPHSLNTTYKIKVVFNECGTETMEDKLLRMIRNEL